MPACPASQVATAATRAVSVRGGAPVQPILARAPRQQTSTAQGCRVGVWSGFCLM